VAGPIRGARTRRAAGSTAVAAIVQAAITPPAIRASRKRRYAVRHGSAVGSGAGRQPAPCRLALGDPALVFAAGGGQRPDVQVEYVFPTDEEYAATWARRIAAGQAEGRPVIATHYDEAAYSALPAPLPLGEAFLFPAEPLAALPGGYTPVDLALGDTVLVTGYQLERDAVAAGEEAVLTLAWRPLQAELPPLSLFAHLVDAGGELRAQVDVPARAQPEGLALTRLPLVPRPGTTPGAYEVLFGEYTADGTPSPGPGGEARLVLQTVEVTARPLPPFTQQPVSRRLVDEERTLVGYDWDHTLPAPRLYLHWRTAEGYVTEVRDDGNASLPPWRGAWGLVRDNPVPGRPGQHYVPLGQGLVWLGEQVLDGIEAAQPGERLALPQRLAASQPVARDLVVSVRLIGYEPDGFHWAWWDLDDGVPALGAIPTLKWIAGSEVRDPHWAEVAAAATSGQKLGGLVRLYDAFTGQAVPVLDERLAAGLPAIPLGEAVVRP
jgi:hypothetical protein